ncbi:MAG TPA: hypothetical protein VL359_08155, partial [bacterium]|nr:hypothetical protein [bacterium]
MGLRMPASSSATVAITAAARTTMAAAGTVAGTAAAAAPAAAAPLESIVLQGKAFSLPYERTRITSRSLLGGRTVAEAITTAVQVCFTAGLVFHDDFLSLYQGKEKRLSEALRQRMGMMETLLDPESYRDLAALYS